jgi:O-antigen/teichoic acid export membrane protein
MVINLRMDLRKLLKNIFSDVIFKNSLFLIITNFSGLAVGFFFWMIATRLYSPNDVGIMSAILSSISLIAVISSAGLPMALTLYLPVNTKNAGKIINSSLIVAVILSMILSSIFLLKIGMLAPKLKIILGNFESIFIFVMTSMMATVSLLFAGIFNAGKRSSFQMAKENVFSVTKTLILIALTGLGAMGIFISWSLGLAIAITTGFFLVYNLWKYKPKIEFDPIIKTMSRFCAGNYIAGIFYNLPKFVFPIIIVNLISADSAGYFFIAMTIAGIFFGVPEAVAGPFLADSSDKDKFWQNVKKAIKFDMSLLIPGLFFLAIFGKFILHLFNPTYEIHSFRSLIILAISSIPLSLLTTFMMIRNAQKRVTTAIMVDAFVAIVTIALSIPLMKLWNIDGIAFSYLVTTTIASIIIILKTENPLGFILKLLKGEVSAPNNI